jgi:hypothetical protein
MKGQHLISLPFWLNGVFTPQYRLRCVYERKRIIPEKGWYVRLEFTVGYGRRSVDSFIEKVSESQEQMSSLHNWYCILI